MDFHRASNPFLLTQVIVFAGICALGSVVDGQTSEVAPAKEQTVIHLKSSLNVGPIDSFALSPDGKSALVRIADRTIQLWYLVDERRMATLTGFRHSPGFSWSPDGDRFFKGDRDDVPTIWDGRTGTKILELAAVGSELASEKYSSVVNSFESGSSWSPDGTWLVTRHSGKIVAVWNTRTGALQCRINAHNDSLVRWSPDSNALMILTEDNSIRAEWLMRQKSEIEIWDVAAARQRFNIRTWGLLSKAAFTPDGKFILTAGGWAAPELWDVATGELHASLLSPPCKPKRRYETCGENYAQLSRDGKLVAVRAHGSAQLNIWDVASGKPLTTIEIGSGIGSFFRGFSPDGRLVAIYQEDFRSTWSFKIDSAVAIFDSVSGKLRTTLTGSNMRWSAHQIIWSNDGQTLATAGGSKGYEGKIWDITIGKLRATIPMIAKEGHVPFTSYFNDLDHISFHPSRPVLIADSEKLIKFWSAMTGELLQTITKSSVSQWSTDRQVLLTIAENKQTLQVWELN